MEAVNFIQKHFKDIDKIFAYRYYKKQHYTCCDLLLVQWVDIECGGEVCYLPATIKILVDNEDNVIYSYENHKLERKPFKHLAKNYTDVPSKQYCHNKKLPVEMSDFNLAYGLFLDLFND